ncbi:hypothetical protein GCM10010306_055910 [Streptomyces umbrinus]|nr:hypothetical protein GCM10010306_055910 [Streptomyces umbrinus]
MGTAAAQGTDPTAPEGAAETGPAVVTVADRVAAGTAIRTVTDPQHLSRCTCARSSRPC